MLGEGVILPRLTGRNAGDPAHIGEELRQRDRELFTSQKDSRPFIGVSGLVALMKLSGLIVWMGQADTPSDLVSSNCMSPAHGGC